MWKEEEHPRNEDGTFREKEKASKLLGVDLSDKTFKMPKKQIDYMKEHPYFKGVELKTVSLEKLVKDNDLDNPITLSNRKRPKIYKPEQDITKEDIIYGKKQPDGKIRIADGRHRIYALWKSGYKNIEIPIK